MKTEEIRDLAIQALEDMKGIDITAIDVRQLTSITDYMIICTGRSTRHNKSLADTVASKAKEMKVSGIKMEGDKDGEWILVDLGDAVVHIMLAEARSFYSLEDLWEPIKDMREQNE